MVERGHRKEQHHLCFHFAWGRGSSGPELGFKSLVKEEFWVGSQHMDSQSSLLAAKAEVV